MLGIDIDSNLVAAAWKRRKHVWSLSAPPTESPIPVHQKRKRKRGSEQALQPSTDVSSHFPISMQHIYGPLTVPPIANTSTTEELAASQARFPYNVAFRTGDWLSETRMEQFDVILA